MRIRHKQGRAAAFTLVEVCVCAAVGSFAFASLYVGISQGMSTLQRAKQKLRATQILVEKFEVIRLYNWTQINTANFVPQTFSDYYYPEGNTNSRGIHYKGTLSLGSATVNSAYTNTMRKVVAELTWVSGGHTNRYAMETFVSEYGIQKYLY